MSDYLPTTEAKFYPFQSNIVSLLATNAKKWGIPEADIADLISKQSAYQSAYIVTVNKPNATDVQLKATSDAKIELIKAIRLIVAQWITKNPKVTNADRVNLEVTVPKETKTSVPPPTTRPVITHVDANNPLTHKIHYRDLENEKSKAKPKGYFGVEVWYKVGSPAPVTPEDLKFYKVDTKTPCTIIYKGDDANKMVFYRFRWINTKGDQGPWSDLFRSLILE